MKYFSVVIFTLFLALVGCTEAFASTNSASDTNVSVATSASAYVLYCADSLEILAGSNINTQMGMASTTKIMTALLTLEQAAVLDKEVEFTEEMIAEGSSMYLKVGDKVRLSDLAAGMMTVSGNDAANAAAIAIGGSIENFAEMMNRKAKEIGMNNTSFVTPSGLSHTDHYSTPLDMAILMSYAMENEQFKELTAKESVTVDFLYPRGHRVTYYNHNRLLSRYEYCIGGKTGYTISTGRCLVTCSEKDGLRLVAVTFNDRNDWQDHIALYDFGFSRYRALVSEEGTFSIDLFLSDNSVRTLGLCVAEDKKALLMPDEEKLVETTITLPLVADVPLKKGQDMGRITYRIDGQVILENTISVNEDVEAVEKSFLGRLWLWLFD